MSENQDNRKQLVQTVTADIQDANANSDQLNVFVVGYKNITSGEMNELRSALVEKSAKLKIIKNTLIKKTFEELGVDTTDFDLKGQNAILITSDDFITPLKDVFQFIKENEKGSVEMGVLNGVVISSEEVDQLSKLPSKEELIAKVVGGFSSPVRGFVYALNGVQSNFVRVLSGIKDQKSE